MFPSFSFIIGMGKVLFQCVVSPGIGHAHVSPVVPHLFGCQTLGLGVIDSVVFSDAILLVIL